MTLFMLAHPGGEAGEGKVSTDIVAVNASGAIADHTFEIRILDPGVQAHAFTFG